MLACVLNSGIKSGVQCFVSWLSAKAHISFHHARLTAFFSYSIFDVQEIKPDGLHSLSSTAYPFQENKDQNNPPMEAGGGSDIQFSKDGKMMYAAFKGVGTPDAAFNGAVLALAIQRTKVKYVGSYTPAGSPKEFSLTVGGGLASRKEEKLLTSSI